MLLRLIQRRHQLIDTFAGARRLSDGARDFTGCPIRVNRHDTALTARPHLTQGVRQQRQGSPIGAAGEDLDETRLHDEPCLFCGLPDDGSESVGAERGENPLQTSAQTLSYIA